MSRNQAFRPGMLTLLFATAVVWQFASAANSAIGATTSVKLLRRISNPSPALSDFFGQDIERFDDKVLIGTFRNAAHLYDVDTGSELLRIASPETEGSRSSFGDAVAQAGNLIAVADSQVDIGAHVRVGSVYLFNGTTGAHVGTIRDPNPFHFARFGLSLESAAGRLFVSDDSHSTNTAGQVRVYNPATRQLLTTISSPRAGWGFGAALEEHEADLFIGASGARVGSLEAGVVYRYDATSTAAPLLTIPSPQPYQYGSFGAALDADGDHLLVGAPNFGATSTGRAYLFNATTGALLLTITNPEPYDFINFGSSVALLDDYIVVAAPGADLNPSGLGPKFVGAAYVFDRDTGGFLAKVLNPNPGQNDQFSLGGMLGIGNRFLAASYLSNNSLGRVYYFNVVPEPSTLAVAATCLMCFFATGRSRSRLV